MKIGNSVFILLAIAFAFLVIFSCDNFELAETKNKYMVIDIEKHEAPGLMQEFVAALSEYAKAQKPGFLIVPQNGAELAYDGLNPENGFSEIYINAIDGMGIEELFFDWNRRPVTYNGPLLNMLSELKDNGLTIMVSDYVSTSNVQNSMDYNTEQGFLAFPRVTENYHYKMIPSSPLDGDPLRNVTSLADAKNYLYLISSDNFSTKRAMINAINNTVYDVLIIDLFFNKTAFSMTEINELRKKPDETGAVGKGGNRIVLAYINIGSAETFRDYWKGSLPFLIRPYGDGYDDEYMVGYWTDEWQKIMFGDDKSYIQRILNAGFDGAYLDNVETYKRIFQ